MPYRLPALLLGLLAPAPALAGPLDVVPAEANLVLVVEDAAGLLDAVTKLPAIVSAPTTFPAVREALATTPVKRFAQVVGHAERELGRPWPELLGQLAGNGAALALKAGGTKAPALLVLDGRDAALAEKAFRLMGRLIEEGVAAGAKLEAGEHAGGQTLHGGDDFHAGRLGARLFVSNRREVLHRALDLAAGRGKARPLSARPEPVAARRLLDPAAKAWLWFDLEGAKKEKGFKDFLDNGAKELFVMVALGSTVDAVRRAPSLAAGLSADAAGVRLSVRLPAKRAELSEALAFHLPPPGEPATLPLLRPPGVVYSQSFYLDASRFWRDRLRLAPPDLRKAIELAERDASKFLPNTTVAQLLDMAGPHHRVVVSRRPAEKLYAAEPEQPLPSFALVSLFRDPAFPRKADGPLRLAGLALSTAFKMSMTETDADGLKIVTYRYNTDDAVYGGADPERARLNFAPSFAFVGDSLVLASDPGLIRDLEPELRRAAKPDAHPAAWRAAAFGAGGAEFLRKNPDEVVATTVLNEGVSLPQARRQVADLCDWLASVGDFGLTLTHGAEAFAVELSWAAGK